MSAGPFTTMSLPAVASKASESTRYEAKSYFSLRSSVTVMLAKRDVVLAALDGEEEVLPRRRLDFDLESERVGHQVGDVDLVADQGRLVVGIQDQRRSVERADTDLERAALLPCLRQRLGDAVDLVDADPRFLLRGRVERGGRDRDRCGAVRGDGLGRGGRVVGGSCRVGDGVRRRVGRAAIVV